VVYLADYQTVAFDYLIADFAVSVGLTVVAVVSADPIADFVDVDCHSAGSVVD